MFASHAGRAQGASEATGRRRKLGIAQRPPGVAEYRRGSTLLVLMPIDKVLDRVPVVGHLVPSAANLTRRMRARQVPANHGH